MTKRNETSVQPIDTFAHILVSKLSAIVGFCQLLQEDLPENSKCVTRVHQIQSVANSMIDEIRTKQRSVDAIMKAGRRAT